VNRAFRTALFPVIIIGALLWLGAQTLTSDSNGTSTGFRFSDALALAQKNPGAIEEVTFHPATQKVDFRLATGRTKTTVYPVDQSAYELEQVLDENGVAYVAKSKGSSPWWSFLTALLPFVLLFGFWVFLTRMVKQRSAVDQTPPRTPSPY
jgi:ATP-dependent Zn protease